MKLHQILIATTLVSISVGCALIKATQGFSPSRWKAASKDDRRGMAPKFLKTYDTKGLNVEQLKELLGEADYERDVWIYNLSTKGQPPRGPHTSDVFLDFPQLYVHFREGRVEHVAVTDRLELRDEVKFEPELWKSSSPPNRLKMTASLIGSKVLERLLKAEVKQLLGAPDAESEEHQIEYDLGLRMVDTVTLTFTLDQDRRITRAEIIEH